MSGASLINPPPSHSTPLASLDGWTLILRCPKCGTREKPVSKLCEALQEHLNRRTPLGERVRKASVMPLWDILPRLTCDYCHSKPAVLKASCTWVGVYREVPPAVDLTDLLAPPEKEEAA